MKKQVNPFVYNNKHFFLKKIVKEGQKHVKTRLVSYLDWNM